MSHSFTASQLISDHSLFLQLGIWSNDWQGLEARQERSHKVLMFNHCVITLICPFRILKPTGRYDLCRVRFCWCCSHLVSSATNTRWDYLIDRIVAILAERARNLASAANSFHAKLDSGSPIPVVLRKKQVHTLCNWFLPVCFAQLTHNKYVYFENIFCCWGFFRVMCLNVW